MKVNDAATTPDEPQYDADNMAIATLEGQLARLENENEHARKRLSVLLEEKRDIELRTATRNAAIAELQAALEMLRLAEPA